MFALRNITYSKLESLNNVRLGVNTRPPSEKNLSTAAEEGSPALYFTNSFLMVGKESNVDKFDVRFASKNFVSSMLPSEKESETYEDD